MPWGIFYMSIIGKVTSLAKVIMGESLKVLGILGRIIEKQGLKSRENQDLHA